MFSVCNRKFAVPTPIVVSFLIVATTKLSTKRREGIRRDVLPNLYLYYNKFFVKSQIYLLR